MFRSFADVRTTASLGFALPDLVGGKAAVHVADPTPQQETVAAWCAERAARQHIARRRRDPRPGHRHLGHRPSRRPAPGHHLRARPARSTPPTATPTLRFSWDEPNEKLITVADRIAEIHHRTADWTYPDSERPGAAQVVFCDAGVPNPDGSPSVYSTLTDLLTERGHRPQPDRLGPRHPRPQPAPTVVGPGPLRPHPGPDRLDDADGRRGQHPDPALRRPRAHRPLPARLARTSRRPPHPPRQQQHRPSRCTATSPNAPPTPTRGRSCNAKPTSSPKRCRTPSR